MSESWTINSDFSFESFCENVKALYQKHRHITYDAPRIGPKRSDDQNRISHAWYAEIAKFHGESPIEAKARCKLEIGVPILRAASEEFRVSYDKAVKPLPYETKLEIMKFFPVTSLMKVKELTEYLEAVQRKYSEQGLMLK